jgi:hypothetical protein
MLLAFVPMTSYHHAAVAGLIFEVTMTGAACLRIQMMSYRL